MLGRCTTGPQGTYLGSNRLAGQRGRDRFRAIEGFDTLAAMPTTPRRRDPSARRRLPPRPSYAASRMDVAQPPGDETRQRREVERAAVAALRESRYLVAELKRVVGVTATCVGMLIVLAILQRVSQ